MSAQMQVLFPLVEDCRDYIICDYNEFITSIDQELVKNFHTNPSKANGEALNDAITLEWCKYWLTKCTPYLLSDGAIETEAQHMAKLIKVSK